MRHRPPPRTTLGQYLDKGESHDRHQCVVRRRGVERSAPQRSRASRAAPTETTGWVGWIVFAAVLMVLIGILHAIEGLVALFKDSYYIVTKQGFLATVDYTAGAGRT